MLLLSTDFQKNRQKIPIIAMLNLRLKCARFYDMGIIVLQKAKCELTLVAEDEVCAVRICKSM